MAEEKTKSNRRTGPKPLYVFVEAKDANGNAIGKDQINVLGATRNTEEALSILDQNPDVAYKKVILS